MTFPYDTRLPPDLAALKVEIEAHARNFGLDFYETIFEVVEADDLNEIASYGGFPTRYPHWSFGMQYEELKKGYEYGLSKIYEMVINNDPCYAYLMRCNHTVDQKLVMAHVYGHCDFFKNNAYFAHTSRKMMDEMANHGVRVRKHVERVGESEVEAFIDRCMSIDDLIDLHAPGIKRREELSRYDFKEQKEEEVDKLTRFESKEYMDEYINPREVLKAEEEALKKKQQAIECSFPERPEKDVLLFLIEYAPLKPWQRDVLSIVRDEAYYFAPQGQTKILNEGWACLVKDSLIFSDRGLMRLGDLVTNKKCVQVHDGDTAQVVYDWARFENRETVKLCTRRGYEVEGSVTHRLMVPNGEWRRLDEFKIGAGVTLICAPQMWAKDEVPVTWQPARRVTLQEVADEVGVDIETVMRFRNGVKSRRVTPALVAAVAEYDQGLATLGPVQARRNEITIPQKIDERVAAILGYLTGDGHISDRKRTIGLTSGDDEQADAFIDLIANVFGLECKKRRDLGRWRVSFSSQDVRDFLVSLGMKTGVSARIKQIPECILQSPKEVVVAFLRAYFDCDGYAGKHGVILSTSSTGMGKTVQLLLLNFGILSTRRPQPKGCWHVHVMGQSAKVFKREIGFGLTRKQDKLRKYVDGHQWFKKESWEDKVVAIERGHADVYDISVAETHRYAAQGFINHNSYWHSTIMTERALEAWECIDYADHHSGTMAMSRGRVNPYKLGIELLRDIERRWNTGQFGKEWEECDDIAKKRAWNLNLGLGRKKIFEVRKIHNDVTFIDTFLTPEFCKEHKLFSFAHNEPQDNYLIESREFPKVKQRLLFSLTNHGRPFIYVGDGNYKNRGELLLRHEYNGIELRMDRAVDTLANVQAIWSRPVHLQTIVDNKPVLISHDGSSPSQSNLGEADDPRKHAPPATN